MYGGEGGGYCHVSQIYERQQFKVVKDDFWLECLTIFATGCLSALTLYEHSVSLWIALGSGLRLAICEGFWQNWVLLVDVSWITNGRGRKVILGYFWNDVIAAIFIVFS